MIDPLTGSLSISGSGLQAQSERMRIVSENIANAQSTGNAPGADAFRRKLIAFESAPQTDMPFSRVEVAAITRDTAPFRVEIEPGHPAADAEGRVKYPNVSMLVELADLRDASRAYEANLQSIKQARQMISATLDLMRERG
jgi:flagellar basal-body rod protein FlgC